MTTTTTPLQPKSARTARSCSCVPSSRSPPSRSAWTSSSSVLTATGRGTWPHGSTTSFPEARHDAMLLVGVIEIVAGLVVALGAAVRRAASSPPGWAGSSSTCSACGDFYDIALRDFGLLVARPRTQRARLQPRSASDRMTDLRHPACGLETDERYRARPQPAVPSRGAQAPLVAGEMGGHDGAHEDDRTHRRAELVLHLGVLPGHQRAGAATPGWPRLAQISLQSLDFSAVREMQQRGAWDEAGACSPTPAVGARPPAPTWC